MSKTLGISPKLAAAIAPPLTAIVSAAILTSTLDKQSAAALAGVVIGALLGYHAPAGVQKLPSVEAQAPARNLPSGASHLEHLTWEQTGGVPLDGMAGTMGPVTGDWRKGVPDDTDGDDQLPAELADRGTDMPAASDEVDQPDSNHPEVK